jgi:hypothetical protein
MAQGEMEESVMCRAFLDTVDLAFISNVVSDLPVSKTKSTMPVRFEGGLNGGTAYGKCPS